jgi:hypothetical protein
MSTLQRRLICQKASLNHFSAAQIENKFGVSIKNWRNQQILSSKRSQRCPIGILCPHGLIYFGHNNPTIIIVELIEPLRRCFSNIFG